MTTIAIFAAVWVVICTVAGVAIMTNSMRAWDTWLGAALLIISIAIGLTAAIML